MRRGRWSRDQGARHEDVTDPPLLPGAQGLPHQCVRPLDVAAGEACRGQQRLCLHLGADQAFGLREQEALEQMAILSLFARYAEEFGVDPRTSD